MFHDIEVKWSVATGHGAPVERWFARVERPTFTDCFAKIERIDGQWWLVVHPNWSIRHRPGLRELRIRYKAAPLAKRHLEAWLRANWPKVERLFGIYKPPQVDMPLTPG